ncbi:uncharacterized [Tachysurus ichikawai]
MFISSSPANSRRHNSRANRPSGGGHRCANAHSGKLNACDLEAGETENSCLTITVELNTRTGTIGQKFHNRLEILLHSSCWCWLVGTQPAVSMMWT